MDPAKLREALRKQGIHGHESDPVLEVAAICELAAADTVKAIEGLNKEAANRISTASTQRIEAAKHSAAAEMLATVLRELRPELARAEAAARHSVRMAWLTGSVGAVALAGLAGFLLAGLGHG